MVATDRQPSLLNLAVIGDDLRHIKAEKSTVTKVPAVVEWLSPPWLDASGKVWVPCGWQGGRRKFRLVPRYSPAVALLAAYLSPRYDTPLYWQEVAALRHWIAAQEMLRFVRVAAVDLPAAYLQVDEDAPLCWIDSTQMVATRPAVNKAAVLDYLPRLASGEYRTVTGTYPQAVRFADEDTWLLLDGHCRLAALRLMRRTRFYVRAQVFPVTRTEALDRTLPAQIIAAVEQDLSRAIVV